MPSSISSFRSSFFGRARLRLRRIAVARPSFFLSALLLLGVTTATAIGLASGAQVLYHPRPLAPDPGAVASSDHFLAIFGNSHFEAGIDPNALAVNLSATPGSVKAQMFDGGGWDALHYYMLALLARDVLRPEKDVVVIEVSPTSLNDSQTSNRLGVIRPETATAIARVAGMPTETRLDVLFGSVATLYRYRTSFQSALQLRLEGIAQRGAAWLGRLGLLGAPPHAPPFELKIAPGRDFVIEQVLGDRAAFLQASKLKAENFVSSLHTGGFKLAALEQAIRVLRERNIAVVLVEPPESNWYEATLLAGPFGVRHRDLVRGIADRTGATYLSEWRPALRENELFWDGVHMVATATPGFTSALALELQDRRVLR